MEEAVQPKEEKVVIITDDERNAKWKTMLKAFEKITDPKPSVDKCKDDLLALSEMATLSVHLTARQKGGIIGRCNNYIKGTYGKNLSHIQTI